MAQTQNTGNGTTKPVSDADPMANIVPDWLNAELFEDIVRAKLQQFDKIVAFKALPAMAPGENYATLMLRITIGAQLKDGSTENLSYMIKLPHDNEEMRQMLKLFNFFDNENTALQTLLPELEDMYKDVGVHVRFGPIAHTFAKDVGYYVVMEDLGMEGFRNANRLECLDMRHAELVLEKLAKYHAGSVCRVAERGPYPKQFVNGMNTELGKQIMKGMILGFADAFFNNLSNFENGEKYRKPMENFFNNLDEELTPLMTPSDDEFNVLAHGDCWSNNMLFKYGEDGKPVDMIFVDYQGPRWSSPIQDILYFIISSTRADIKLTKFNYFLRFYYDHLIDNLQLLKFAKPLPTLSDLHIQSFKLGSWSVITAIMVLPIVILDPTENAKFENFMSTNEAGKSFKDTLYKNKRYSQYINELLPWFYERGIINGELNGKKCDRLLTNGVPNGSPKTVVQSNPIPAWVSVEYFTDIFKKNVKGYKSVKDFKVTSASTDGENFATILLKVDAVVYLQDGSTNALSYILKVGHTEQKTQDMMSLFSLFDKEQLMYWEILPQFENIFKKAGMDVVIGPKSFKFTKNPGCEQLLLENLAPMGFKNTDRLAGTNLEHTKWALKKLAEFHAVSAYYFQTKGPFPAKLMEGMFSSMEKTVFKDWREEFLNVFVGSMNQFEDCEVYAEKIVKNLQPNYLKLMVQASEIDETRFNVLNHGDAWTNNFMFKYDEEGRIIDAILIDFQMSKFGSPAQDLYYFLMSSPSLDIKLSRFDYLIEVYYANLKKYLHLLKYPKRIPSLDDLKEDLERCRVFAINTVSGIMTGILLDPASNARLESVLRQDEVGATFKKQLFLNPRYKQHIEALLPWLNRRGLLEFRI